jgi:tetratricopeptide (TPR) repeat protein
VGDPLSQADTLLLRDHQPLEALELYRASLARDTADVEALWRASRACAVLGILAQDWDSRKAWHREGADLARKAEALRPGDLELTYWRVANLGRWAQEEPGAREVIGLAREVRAPAEEILAGHPNHAGAHNVLGMFYFEILSLNRAKRAIARVLAPGTLRGVRWEEAHNHLRRAVALEPFNVLYLKDYGRALLWHGDLAEAGIYLERALHAPLELPTDPVFQREAEILLEEVTRRVGG